MVTAIASCARGDRVHSVVIRGLTALLGRTEVSYRAVNGHTYVCRLPTVIALMPSTQFTQPRRCNDHYCRSARFEPI
jgi:hypothetical protein